MPRLKKADEIRGITKFLYHPDKTTHGMGALSHTSVLSVAAWLISNRPTLRRILEDRHPLVLIDESQDTMKGILDALLGVAKERPGRFHLGLLGDHRQRIYPDGHRDLPSHVPDTWAVPALKMNHRARSESSTSSTQSGMPTWLGGPSRRQASLSTRGRRRPVASFESSLAMRTRSRSRRWRRRRAVLVSWLKLQDKTPGVMLRRIQDAGAGTQACGQARTVPRRVQRDAAPGQGCCEPQEQW